jgi:hypothetical protein
MDNFLSTWNGKCADYDVWYGAECVDLYNYYMRDVFGLNPYAHGVVNGAQELAQNLPKYPELTWNQSSDNIPKGAIVVFSGANGFGGGYGHVGMSMGGLTLFDQLGNEDDSKEQPAGTRNYNAHKSKVLGYAIKKEDNVIEEKDLAPIRIVMSEVEGWNGHEIHAGKHDKMILGWVGKTWEEFIQHGWNVQPRHRIYIEEENTLLKQQLAEVQATLANELAKPPKEVIKEAVKIVEKVVEVPKIVEKPFTDKDGVNWLTTLLKRIFKR